MKFFITGATGFIGQHLCHKLSEQGHSIVALVRNPKKATVLPQKNIQIIQGDLNSLKDPNFKIPACDQVIHLAAVITAKKQSEYEKIGFGTVVDLYSCLKNQSWQPSRILFSSSLAAVGPSLENLALQEHHTPNPIDAYGKSKLKAEKFLLAQTDFPTTIFRPCAVIGPMDANVLNLYKMVKLGFGFVPWGKEQQMSFIAVSDLVEAIFKLTQDTSNAHKVYFVSHPKPTSTKELWDAVAKSLNKKVKLIPVPLPLLYLAMQVNTLFANLFSINNVFDKKYYDQLKEPAWLCSSEKLEQDFDWKAKKSLTETCAETAIGYRQAGWI